MAVHQRTSPVAPAALAAGAAAVLVPLALAGRWPLAAGVIAVQALLLWGAVVTTVPPGVGGVAAVSAGTALLADVVLAADDEARPARLSGVLALAVLAALVHQLTRGVARVRVVESLSSTVLLAVLVVCAATALTLRAAGPGGARAVVLWALAGGLGLAAGRLADAVAPGPLLVHGRLTRTLAGALAGFAAAAASGIAWAVVAGGRPGAADGTVLALVVAAAVTVADLAVAAGLSTVAPDVRATAPHPPPAILRPVMDGLRPEVAVQLVAVAAPLALAAAPAALAARALLG